MAEELSVKLQDGPPRQNLEDCAVCRSLKWDGDSEGRFDGRG